MKCPLYVAMLLPSNDIVSSIAVSCNKEECGWWDELLEQCCIKTEAKALDRLERVMTDIRGKMPTAGQFTK